jgi:hypothetical protein
MVIIVKNDCSLSNVFVCACLWISIKIAGEYLGDFMRKSDAGSQSKKAIESSKTPFLMAAGCSCSSI